MHSRARIRARAGTHPPGRRCEPCRADQYLLDSTNPAHRCQDCPAGAACNGSALASRVPGAVWAADAASGRYVLQSCPPGYQRLNTDDGSGAFSHAAQVARALTAACDCVCVGEGGVGVGGGVGRGGGVGVG